ncbi:hypothetical protein V1280_001921 [Bradyrhizobium sp. AZCC 2230]
MSDSRKFELRERLVPPVLVPIFFALPIAVAAVL